MPVLEVILEMQGCRLMESKQSLHSALSLSANAKPPVKTDEKLGLEQALRDPSGTRNAYFDRMLWHHASNPGSMGPTGRKRTVCVEYQELVGLWFCRFNIFEPTDIKENRCGPSPCARPNAWSKRDETAVVKPSKSRVTHIQRSRLPASCESCHRGSQSSTSLD